LLLIVRNTFPLPLQLGSVPGVIVNTSAASGAFLQALALMKSVALRAGLTVAQSVVVFP
jgi:hypothetical protein